MFVYYCYSQAAKMKGRVLPFRAGNLWSGYKLEKWSLLNQDKVVRTAPILPGDIYVMNNNHIGMVTEQMTETHIMKTVDGNQSYADSGKDSLRARTRKFADMKFFIRI
jgi:hypothetical protein